MNPTTSRLPLFQGVIKGVNFEPHDSTRRSPGPECLILSSMEQISSAFYHFKSCDVLDLNFVKSLFCINKYATCYCTSELYNFIRYDTQPFTHSRFSLEQREKNDSFWIQMKTARENGGQLVLWAKEVC